MKDTELDRLYNEIQVKGEKIKVLEVEREELRDMIVNLVSRLMEKKEGDVNVRTGRRKEKKATAVEV